VNFKTQE